MVDADLETTFPGDPLNTDTILNRGAKGLLGENVPSGCETGLRCLRMCPCRHEDMHHIERGPIEHGAEIVKHVRYSPPLLNGAGFYKIDIADCDQLKITDGL